jgi:hypothetical protein
MAARLGKTAALLLPFSYPEGGRTRPAHCERLEKTASTCAPYTGHLWSLVAAQLGLICLADLRRLAAFIPHSRVLSGPSPRTGDAIPTVVALPETTLALASD